MKNIITIATLLAAGTAFANAETVITVKDLSTNSSSGSISYLVNDSAGTFSGDGLFTNYSGRYTAGFTFNLNLTALGITNSSSTFSPSSGTSLQLVDYKTSESSTGSEIGLAAISNGIQFTWNGGAYLTATYVPWSKLLEKKYEVGGNSYVTMTLVAANQAGGSSVARGAALYDEEGNIFKASNGSDYKFLNLTSTAAYSVITLGDVSKLSGASVFSGSPTTEEIKSASQSILVIPEPSAFGLLAGLGALALVGARRRRR